MLYRCNRNCLNARIMCGRILIEIEPELKEELYDALQKEGVNLKSWFLDNVQDYLSDRSQLKLFLTEQTTTTSIRK